MKKPIYLRLDNFSHAIIEELLENNIAKTKTDVIQFALEKYFHSISTSEEYSRFLTNYHTRQIRGDENENN